MRKLSNWTLALITLSLLTVALPSRADALVRLGVDGIWMPLAFQTYEGEGEDGGAKLDSTHELSSFGVSAHAAMGFDIFAVGLKLNYFNKGVDFETGDNRFSELDINLLGRVGIPMTSIAVFAEVGPATNLTFDYVGYNIGGGVMYDLLDMPLIEFNVGLMGQYVNISEFEVEFGDTGYKSDVSLSEGRVMFFVGMDFSI